MMNIKRLAGIGLLALAAGGLLIIGTLASKPTTLVLRGVVLAEAQPVVNAVVRVQGHAEYVLTNTDGAFELSVSDAPVHITAWSPGYYIAVTEAVSPDKAVNLHLHRHPTTDNPDYAFISPTLDPDHPSACARCHRAPADAPQLSLPVDEWLQDAHASAAVNPRFLSLYTGTTLTGETGEPTTYRFDSASAVNIPVAPSLGQDSTGAGFRLDFPNQAGPCATCHVPLLALESPYNADPTQATGVAREGITCDFCHKLWDVRVAASNLPAPHLPGVLSIAMLRPPDGEQIFIGPFDDTPGDDVYSPLQDDSRLCAACHTGTFWGVTMYNSYGEWLASPYSDPAAGQTCQDCHMPRLGMTTFVSLPPDVNQFVPERDPATIFSHRMPGAADVHLLQNTAELELTARVEGIDLVVTARVTNALAGHHIPTDNPLRNMLLLVDARDSQGQPLALVDGPIIPDWGGVGDPESGNYAGLPGVLYAKVLADFYTGETPTTAYWRQTRLVSDNRIPALATDESVYRFRLPSSGASVVEARLIFRRAFIELMQQKGWDTPDILMEQTRVVIE